MNEFGSSWSTVPADEQASMLLARLSGARSALFEQMHKVIVGQDSVLEHLLIALLCRGHCLLQGVPGVAKTAMVHTLAQVLDLKYARVQFTPDLMPADITGTDIIQEDPESGRRQYEFLPGPLFANLLLADEVNRTPPKTQAALLQAMQEHNVTIRGCTYELPDPFFVLATQNPIEQEGTYSLPEAQLDRFMFMLLVDYPERDQEMEVLRRTTGKAQLVPSQVFTADEVRELQELVREVPVPEPVFAYVVDLVRATRPAVQAVAEVSEWLQWGAGPRAGQMLILGGKARALLHGRFHVSREDIQALAGPVLRHRLVVNFAGQADGVHADQLIEKLLTEL